VHEKAASAVVREVRLPEEAGVFLDLLAAHYADAAARDGSFVLKRDWRAAYLQAMAAGAGTGRHRFAMAWLDGKAVGLCASWWRSDSLLETPGSGVISELYVVTEARRGGLGRLLADDALAWFAAENVTRVSISTRVEGGAREFWARMGFAETAVTMTRRDGSRLAHP
jgi:GNAT superfamily N-acetyltransferase